MRFVVVKQQDFPFIDAKTTAQDFVAIMNYPGLTADEKEGVLSRNYRSLFGDKLSF